MRTVDSIDAAFPSFERECSDEERDLAALEPAWGKAATFFRTGSRFGHARSSIRTMSLERVHQLLEVHHRRFEKGNTFSLLQAIAHCAEENLPLPEWLAVAFQAKLNAFLEPGVLHSLDEVFESVYVPTGSAKKAATARQDWKLGGRLWHDAWQVARKDETLMSLDSVVERLLTNANFGVGKTKAKRLMAMVEASQAEFLGEDVSLSRFLAKRRKQMT
jgi:hypothetical protein